MEKIRFENSVDQTFVANDSASQSLAELTDLQLADIGGGIGDTVLVKP